MCLDPFGFDFNSDGEVDFYESYLTHRIMEDAISANETFEDFGDESLEDFDDESFDADDDLWSDEE